MSAWAFRSVFLPATSQWPSTLKGGIAAGVAGIVPDPDPGVGIIWMLCTPAVQKEPINFVKQAKQWLAEEQATTAYFGT